ncbi:MAG: roadblock/LC7 family [Geobacteraceae bacterium]|nr:MAG: roadblock/LC7 family [Geobacteraceae bacterium]
MPFKSILTDLVKSVPGANGAVLADWEGESVELCCLSDDFELKVIGAHKGIILNRMKEIHARFPAGEVQEAVISTATHHIIIGTVGPDYSLVMILDRCAVVGLARQRFRNSVKLLEKEIY